MSQGSSQHDVGETSTSDLGKSKKFPEGVKDCPSRLSREDVLKLVVDYPCLARYNSVAPSEDEMAHRPPPDKVAFYKAYLTSSNLRFPLTPFYLKVLTHYKLGVAQVHPFGAGKIVQFEMLLKALGQPLSIYMFRKTFLSTRKGDWFSFIFRGNKLMTDPPSKVALWRFDYFFMDATFIPNEPRGILRWGRDLQDTKASKKANAKVADNMVDLEHFKSLQAVSIPYQSYPRSHEGVLAMAGISPDLDWKKIHVLIDASTQQPLSLMDALQFDFSRYLVQPTRQDVALDLRQEAGETIPIRPEGVDCEGDGAQILHGGDHSTHPVHDDDSTHASHDGASHDGVSHHSDHVQAIDHSSSGVFPHSDVSPMPPHPSHHHGDDYCGEYPEGDDDLIDVEGDTSVPVGGKRVGEDLDGSLPKHPKTIPSPSLIGFQTYAGVTSSTFRDLGSCSFALASSSCGAIMSSPSGFIGATGFFGISDMSGMSGGGCELLPTSSGDRPGWIGCGGYLSGDGPSRQVAFLSKDHWTEIFAASSYRQGIGSSSGQAFMSHRAGSTLVPPPTSEFTRGVGSCFYVPPPVIRVREDGQNPHHARGLIDSIVPPILMAEAVSSWTWEGREGLQALARRYDLDALNSAVSGSLMRQTFLMELDQLDGLVGELRGQVASKDSELSSKCSYLEKERSISADFKEKSEKAIQECSSLRDDVRSLTDEKKILEEKVTELERKLIFQQTAMDHKKNELAKAEARHKEEMETLRRELDTERQLKAERVDELVAEVERSRELIDATSEVFRRLLDHPEIDKVFGDFNTKAIHFGEFNHSTILSEARPELNIEIVHPSAFQEMPAASAVWRAKEFPVLDRIVSVLGTRDVPVAELLDRIAPRRDPPQ